MLGLTLQQLSKEVDVSHEAINKIENGTIKNPRPKTIEVLVDFFERKGLEFGKQSGVGFRSRLIWEIEGEDCSVKLLDDAYHTLEPGDELLIACADNKVSPPAINSAIRRIREKGVRMRYLIEEDNTYILGQLNEYRHIPTDYFYNCPFFIYKNKFACAVTDENKAIVIEDDSLSQTFRGIFNALWQSGSPALETTASERF